MPPRLPSTGPSLARKVVLTPRALARPQDGRTGTHPQSCVGQLVIRGSVSGLAGCGGAPRDSLSPHAHVHPHWPALHCLAGPRLQPHQALADLGVPSQPTKPQGQSPSLARPSLGAGGDGARLDSIQMPLSSGCSSGLLGPALCVIANPWAAPGWEWLPGPRGQAGVC